jgi:hypothetical protein
MRSGVPLVTNNTPGFLPVENGDQFGVIFASRADVKMASISTGGGTDRDRGFPCSSAARWMPSPSTVRKTRDREARGLPFSTSTIHCRLTPTLVARVF